MTRVVKEKVTTLETLRQNIDTLGAIYVLNRRTS